MNANDIWLIAGLGNPEAKYDGTRHNAGFAALDSLAGTWVKGPMLLWGPRWLP